MNDHSDLVDALEYLDPSTMSYEEWTNVGMALKESGLDISVWDTWSAKDSARYVSGECEKKWSGFGNYGGRHIGSGYIAKAARENGWEPTRKSFKRGSEALDLMMPITLVDEPPSGETVIDEAWIESDDPTQFREPWKPVSQIVRYLDVLYQGEDMVNFVFASVNGKPSTAGTVMVVNDLKNRLAQAEDTDDGVWQAMESYNKENGAWIRINPVKQRGGRNEDVSDFRYALVESDSVPKDKQLGFIKELHLPCAAIVFSGKKSVHAVVRVDAFDYREYRERVDFLFNYCKKRGFTVDTQNKNPGRLTRLPGIVRGDNRQWLMETNSGCKSWNEWLEWINESEDDLPPDTNSDWDDPIVLAPPLIGTEQEGILRQGQKMVLAAPSKVGKSYAIIDLAEAIACGGRWWGYPCAKGKVFYVNLEIDDMSFRMRQHVVWADRDAHMQVGDGLDEVKKNFVRWDLRGHACNMAKLAPLIVRRVLKRGKSGEFMAVIVDPIYKVNGGDENDAQAISEFTNQLDLIAEKCGCAVIYVHHHAKGNLGYRSAVDRMSGSGVFARDADAILDLAPLALDEAHLEIAEGKPVYRLDCTLREFPTPKPKDMIFKFPRFYPVDGFSDVLVSGETGERGNKPTKPAKPATGKDGGECKKGSGRVAGKVITDKELYGYSDKKKLTNRDWSTIARRKKTVQHIAAAIEACREEGIPPTRTNVLDKYNELGGIKKMRMDRLRQLTTLSREEAVWCPFKCAGPEGRYELYNSLTEVEPNYYKDEEVVGVVENAHVGKEENDD